MTAAAWKMCSDRQHSAYIAYWPEYELEKSLPVVEEVMETVGEQSALSSEDCAVVRQVSLNHLLGFRVKGQS